VETERGRSGEGRSKEELEKKEEEKWAGGCEVR